MADTAHKNPEDMIEHFETNDVVKEKAQHLVSMIAESKYVVFFTGAGVSTGAGIPDFRGPDGVWTLAAQKKERTGPTTSTLKAYPTLTHMSLVELQNKGILKYIVSGNTDGLHRRSGIQPDIISEVHGNTNLEMCSACGKRYMRDFHASAPHAHVHDHSTPRKCECGGMLEDSIINFGEKLPKEPMNRAYGHLYKADLLICLGSSITVSTWVLETIMERGPDKCKIVICNLQNTPFDKAASLRIYSKCDSVMALVMEGLGLEIPKWKLTRHVRIGRTKDRVYARGVDSDGSPFQLLAGVDFTLPGTKAELIEVGKNSGHEVSLPLPSGMIGKVKMQLQFMGHYKETSLDVEFAVTKDQKEDSWEQYVLQWDPFAKQWEAFVEDSS